MPYNIADNLILEWPVAAEQSIHKFGHAPDQGKLPVAFKEQYFQRARATRLNEALHCVRSKIVQRNPDA